MNQELLDAIDELFEVTQKDVSHAKECAARDETQFAGSPPWWDRVNLAQVTTAYNLKFEADKARGFIDGK